MRFNVTTVPDETELMELSFSKEAAAELKATDYITVGDLLYAFSNRSVFIAITEKPMIYDIALTICNPKLTETYKTSRFAFLDDDTAVQDQLNASLLMLSAEAQAVLKRFEVTVPEQLGYVLTEEENGNIMDAAYERDPDLYEILDRMLRDIYDVYSFYPENYEVNIRGQFAAETYNLEIKDVFKEEEFKKFRQFCDDIGAVWIKNLAGFSPDILRKCIDADEDMVSTVAERCKRIEQGAAAKYAGIRIKSHKTKLSSRAKQAAVDRHRRVSYDTISKTGIYGEHEIVNYVFIDPVMPSYVPKGLPLAFSYCDDAVMCCSWEDLLVKVIRFLYREYPEKIEKFVRAQENSDIPVFLYKPNRAEKISCPRKINHSLIAETDLSSEDIMNIIKTLIAKCKIPEQEFSITCFCSLKSVIEYYSTNDVTALTSGSEASEDIHGIDFDDDIFSKRRMDFEEWLEDEKGYSYIEVRECIASIHAASEWAVKLKITSKKFFDINDTYKLIRCCEALLANRKFIDYERLMNYCFEDAIDLLIDFCMDSDSYEAADEDDEEYDEEYEDFADIPRIYTSSGSQRRKQFAKWLTNDKKISTAKVGRYIEAINTASSWAGKLSITATNLFNVKDIGELTRMTDKLLANPQFSKYDTSKRMLFTDAIDLLVDYCYENE